MKLDRSENYRLALTNHNVPKTLGNITSVLADRNINVVDMLNQSRDEIAYNLIDISAAPDEDLIKALVDVDSVMNVRVFDRPTT